MAFPLGIFFGGLTMLIVAVLEILRRNALGGAAFGTYGSFWISVGVCKLTRLWSHLVVVVVVPQGRIETKLQQAGCSGGYRSASWPNPPQSTPPAPPRPSPPRRRHHSDCRWAHQAGRMWDCSWLHAWEQSHLPSTSWFGLHCHPFVTAPAAPPYPPASPQCSHSTCLHSPACRRLLPGCSQGPGGAHRPVWSRLHRFHGALPACLALSPEASAGLCSCVQNCLPLPCCLCTSSPLPTSLVPSSHHRSCRPSSTWPCPWCVVASCGFHCSMFCASRSALPACAEQRAWS